MNEVPKKYEISYWPYCLGLGFLIAAFGWFVWRGYTYENIHSFLIEVLKNKKYQAIATMVLLLVGFIHSILASLKKNIDSYGKKNVIDIYVWLSSTFTVIGTGFLAFTSLKIFCGLLGEAACNVPFLVVKDGFTLWPFIVITFLAVLYCAIKIGITITEIIELIKMLFLNKNGAQPVNNPDQVEDINDNSPHAEANGPI